MAAKVQYINEGFTSGEISQDLQGRVSSDMYKESVAAIENMVCTVQGAAIRRPGTKFVAEASQQQAESGHRLIPYKIDASRSVVFHAGPSNLTAYDQGGQVTSVSVGSEIVVNTNPNFTNQLNGWVKRTFHLFYAPTITYQAPYASDVSWDAVRPSARIEVKSWLNGEAGGVGDFYAQVALVQAVVLEPNTLYTLSFKATSPTVKANPATPNPSPGSVRVVEVSNPANYYPTNTSYATNVLATLPYNINTQSGTVSFTTPAWGTSKTVHLEIRLGNQGFTYSGMYPVWGIVSFMTSCKITKSGAAPGVVSFASPWAGKDINLLSFAQTPEFPSKLILTHPDVAPQQLIYTPSTDNWALTPVTFIGSPWAGGEYPGVVGVHLGRLVLASSRVKPERIWFSKVLDYFNFTIGTGASDAFFGDLSEPGRVMWVRSMWSLVVGAESGLWDISAVSGSVLGPGNAKTFKHQAHHASNTFPAFTNNEVAYISEGGRRMYSVRREGDENAYTDRELSFTARHLASSGYRDIAWSEFPYNNLWASMPNGEYGSLVAATYEPKMLEMAGWHRHDVNGAVLAIATITVGGVDQVFLLVGRSKGDIPYLAVERFDWSTYLDASVLRTYSSATAVIDGLTHLDGQEVYALSSTGVVYGPHVVAAGQITLVEPVVSVVVGIPFTSRLVTKRPENLTPTGTAQGLKKHWNKIFVRVSPGSRPIVNGIRPPERDPATPMNEGQSAAYEDVEVATSGWSKEGFITIEEFLPVPLTVAAVFGHITAEIL